MLPFTKVPRQPHEKEVGGGGVTTQAGHMQQCTAQGSPGKVGGVHGRWDLRTSLTRSASRCIVFIMLSLSVVAFLVVTQETWYAPAWPFAMGCSPHVASHESQPQHLAGLAKVVTVDGEADGQREQGGAAKEGPDKQTPVMETFATNNAKTEIGMKECHQIPPVQ